MEDLMRVVNDNYDQVATAGAALEEFRVLFNSVTTWDMESYAYNDGQERSAKDMIDDLRTALQWKEMVVKQMKVSTECGIFHVETRALRDRVRPLVEVAVSDRKNNLLATAGARTTRTLEQLQTAVKHLNDRPRNLEDFSDFLTAVRTDRTELLACVRDCDSMYSTCTEVGMKLSSQEALKHEDLHESVELLQESTAKARRQVEDLMTSMCEKLDEELRAENEELQSILTRLNSSEFIDPGLSPPDTLEKLEIIGRKLRVAEQSLEQSMVYEQKFRDLALPDRSTLDETLKAFEYRREFWTRVGDWRDSEDMWLSTKFVELEIQDLAETLTSYLASAQQLFREYHEPVVLDLLKTCAEQYQQWLPSLFLLRHQAGAPIEQRHVLPTSVVD
jgi:hypothetical protein